MFPINEQKEDKVGHASEQAYFLPDKPLMHEHADSWFQIAMNKKLRPRL